MPTYDYRCDACGHGFELFQSIKSEPIKVCPKCGVDRARRVIGAGGGFIFKGSGFYITDYTRSKDYKDKTKSESSSGSAPAAKPETKSDPGKSDSGSTTSSSPPSASGPAASAAA